MGIWALKEGISIENRAPDAAIKRALVVDYALAKVVAWFFGGGFILILITAYNVGSYVRESRQTMALHGIQIEELGRRLDTRKQERDTQLSALQSGIQRQVDLLADRIRPLEIAIPSVTTLLEGVKEQGSSNRAEVLEMGRKLDRLTEIILRREQPADTQEERER